MSRFDAVVLDFDGVIVESVDVKTRAFAELYSPYGSAVVEKVLAHHLVQGGLSRFEKFRHYHNVFLEQPLTAAEEASLGARFSALVEDAVVAAAWIPGAIEYLEQYHRRLPVFVASGTPEVELQRIVRRRGMGHYFAGVYGSPRTKGAIITTSVIGRGFERERVLMVGDAINDYEGAQAAGVAFLGITSQAGVFPDGISLLPDLTDLARFVGLQAS